MVMLGKQSIHQKNRAGTAALGCPGGAKLHYSLQCLHSCSNESSSCARSDSRGRLSRRDPIEDQQTTSKASDGACAERSRRECPTHTSPPTQNYAPWSRRKRSRYC